MKIGLLVMLLTSACTMEVKDSRPPEAPRPRLEPTPTYDGRSRTNADAAWRDRYCRETCEALGYQTMMWATTQIGTGLETICRCEAPDGILHVRDYGDGRMILNKGARAKLAASGNTDRTDW
jgi:hypothetical protein